MSFDDSLIEARRQIQICNACRYCEGYCAVFPAITRSRAFSEGDLTQLANLCHNCRGCYYACQYTAPHEFDLNLPLALAEMRRESWETYIWPSALGRLFQTHAGALIVACMTGFALLFWLTQLIGPTSGEGFYSVLSHSVMVALFAPAFCIPLISLGFGLRSYWRDVGGRRLSSRDLRHAFGDAAKLRNLSGGHGEGCNFERQDRFSNARRHAHHAVMYGFLLCFASTATGTVLHYVFAMPAPYDLISLPKFFGLTGGVLLTLGCVSMLRLKAKSDPALGDPAAHRAEAAFVALLGFVGFSGLALYVLGPTPLMPPMLAVHLGAVLTFFLLTPYTKMAHGFFRLAALLRDAQDQAR